MFGLEHVELDNSLLGVCVCVLCHAGCFATSLVSTHQTSVDTPLPMLVMTTKNIPRHCQMFPWEVQNYPCLRTMRLNSKGTSYGNNTNSLVGATIFFFPATEV